jgi:hypothetical protein
MARVSSRAFKADRAEFRAACAEANLHCWLCSQAIDYDAAHDDYGNDDRFELDHYYPVSTHPELQADPANYRPSHAGCNRARGNDTVTSTLAGTLSRDWTGEASNDSSDGG